MLASDPKVNGLFSVVFSAAPKAGNSGLVDADLKAEESNLGAVSAPNVKPPGFATEGDPNVGTSGFVLGAALNADTSGVVVDDPKERPNGLAAEPKAAFSVFEGAPPKLNMFEGVVAGVVAAAAAGIATPKLGAAELVEDELLPNENAFDFDAVVSTLVVGTPKADGDEVETADFATPNEKPPLTCSDFCAAGAEATVEEAADDGVPKVNGLVIGLLVVVFVAGPVETVVVTVAGTPNEKVDVGVDAGADEFEVGGLIPKLKVLSFLSTSSLVSVAEPNPKEKFDVAVDD